MPNWVWSTVRGTAGNGNDVVEANSLVHGEEGAAFADSGYRGAHKLGVTWHSARRPSSRKPAFSSTQNTTA